MNAPSGTSLRIRKPHPHDVLSGRGGGINSHSGNKAFRTWVRERKEDYNLAITKLEKAQVAHHVMELVRNQDPPGRFLQRDPNSSPGCSWWQEVDSNRALAKTSQALREGAPQIRAAHKDELGEKMERARRSKRRKTTTNPPPPPSRIPVSTTSTSTNLPPPDTLSKSSQSLPTAASLSTLTTKDTALRDLEKNVQEAKSRAAAAAMPVPPPLMSTRDFQETYMMKSPKKARFDLFHPDETPPLTSSQYPPPPMKPLALPPPTTRVLEKDPVNALLRTHSLALSDFSHAELQDINEDFVNPFDDESDIVSKIDTTTRGVLRNLDENKKTRYVTRNCFCDCGKGECICSDLADHLLHRDDGLKLFLHY